MTMLLTEKTKQEKITNEAQKRRNLFGLGLTSLIAACSADDAKDGAKVDRESVPLRYESNLHPNSFGIPSDSPGGVGSRDDSDVNDVQITVKPDQRGLNSGDPLVLRIANGNHPYSNPDQGPRAVIYKDLTGKYDLVVTSYAFGDATVDGGTKAGAMYIFWDIGKIKSDAIAEASAAADTLALKHLRVAGVDGNKTSSLLPTFYHIGGEADQPDMVFKSGTTTTTVTNINIIWDVTKHATTDVEGETELTPGDAGILQVKSSGYDVFTKINNNNGYDMIVYGDAIYILWDVANYHDPDGNVAVDPADPDTAEYGLLTISYIGSVSFFYRAKILGQGTPKNNGFADIDGGGTHDLAFSYDSSIYILFGEKVADIDKDGKAISHTVDLDAVANRGEFYDKAGDEVAAGEGGFFHFDLDGASGNPEVKNVGYRFVGTTDLDNLADITKEYGKVGLSEEAYWDIA